jgi:hypothetical protein
LKDVPQLVLGHLKIFFSKKTFKRLSPATAPQGRSPLKAAISLVALRTTFLSRTAKHSDFALSAQRCVEHDISHSSFVGRYGGVTARNLAPGSLFS